MKWISRFGHHLGHSIPWFLVLLLVASFGISASAQNKDKPNILFVLIDDMGWKDLSCTGSTYYDTPHIDGLAAGGKRFLNAYSAAPVCSPSRGAIFSGKYPARTKLTTVYAGKAGPDDRLYDRSKYRGDKDQFFEARHRHVLPSQEVILAQALAEGGYKTGFFGKWHIGACEGYYPDQRGFDVAMGYRKEAGHTGAHFGDKWVKGNFANAPDPEADEFIPDLLTDACIRFIKDNRDRPFFAFLSHYIVHSPVTPRPEKVPKYQKLKPTDQNNPEYAALVESVDDSVGQVLQCLKDLGLEENTLVIFTSDNGGLTLRNTSNYPLMGGKSFGFEAGMKVPLIVSWPARIKPGVETERVIGMDFYPTLLAAAGLPMRPDQHMDGLNLVSLLRQEAPLEDRPLIFHFPHYTHATGPLSSIIENEWKLIRYYNDREGAYLLYDLATDPQEQLDLADARPDIRKRLESRLDNILAGMDAEMPTKNPDYKPDPKHQEKNLKSTMNLALKERRMFEERLAE